MEPLIVASVLATFLFAAFLKGTAGPGFATTCLGVMASYLDLKVAIPLVIIPSLASNTLVMIEAGGFVRVFRQASTSVCPVVLAIPRAHGHDLNRTPTQGVPVRTSPFRCILAALFVFLLACPAGAGSTPRTAKGQKVYVPAYSHIYQGVKGRPFNLAVMLSIRNVDDANPITVTMIKYYDDHGELVKNHLDAPLTIGPMGTREIYLPDHDSSGGSGANFIVRWTSPNPVSVPVIQAVMIGTASTQGISFVCDGVVLEEE